MTSAAFDVLGIGNAIVDVIARELEAQVWPLLESQKVAPVVYTTFPLTEASEAHRLLESGGVVGKLVLRV